jgi:hypothetical protein
MRNSGRFRHAVWSMAVVVTAAFMSGCGGAATDNLAREAVWGEVLLDGNPAKSGVITFVPDSAGLPAQGGGPIIEGKFSVSKEQGLVPGKYRVVINALSENQLAALSDAGHLLGPRPRQAAPRPRRAAPRPRRADPSAKPSNDFRTVEVKAGGPNVFEFSLSASNEDKSGAR